MDHPYCLLCLQKLSNHGRQFNLRSPPCSQRRHHLPPLGHRSRSTEPPSDRTLNHRPNPRGFPMWEYQAHLQRRILWRPCLCPSIRPIPNYPLAFHQPPCGANNLRHQSCRHFLRVPCFSWSLISQFSQDHPIDVAYCVSLVYYHHGTLSRLL